MLFATQNEAIPTEQCQCGLISQLLQQQMQQIKPLSTQPKSTVNYELTLLFHPLVICQILGVNQILKR